MARFFSFGPQLFGIRLFLVLLTSLNTISQNITTISEILSILWLNLGRVFFARSQTFGCVAQNSDFRDVRHIVPFFHYDHPPVRFGFALTVISVLPVLTSLLRGWNSRSNYIELVIDFKPVRMSFLYWRRC